MSSRANPVTFSALRRLGFNDYEARAYLAVLAEGPLEARQVAESADVPANRVHAVLNELAQRGWVDVERTRPQRYGARPPGDRLRREWADAQREHAEASAELETLYRGGEAEPSASRGEWVVEGQEELREHSRLLLRSARDGVLATLPFLTPWDGDVLVPGLMEAARRGVRVRLLLGAAVLPEVAHDPQWTLLADAGVDVRTSPFPARLLVADFRVALMVVRAPDDGEGAAHGLWNPVEPFVHLMRPALDGFWRDGVPLQEGLVTRVGA